MTREVYIFVVFFPISFMSFKKTQWHVLENGFKYLIYSFAHFFRYSQPEEARKPKTKWRLYVFKGNEELPILYVHRQSAYLLGRDRKVADIPLDHPSCSKQHAVLQYRLMPFKRPNGTQGRKVIPYIVDLNSANGTFVNNQKIESQKYVQLLEKDVLKFGFSSREYVMLHDQSKEDEEDPGMD